MPVTLSSISVGETGEAELTETEVPENVNQSFEGVHAYVSESVTVTFPDPSYRAAVTTGPTPSVATAEEASDAKRLPDASTRETLKIWTEGVESVSGKARSVRWTVKPLPLDAYEATEYQETVAVTPETFPLRVSEKITKTESVFPSESESFVTRERTLGATPSETGVEATEFSGFAERSVTDVPEYAYEYDLAVSVAVGSDVTNRYVLESTAWYAPVNVEVPAKEMPENEEADSGSENPSSTA